MRQGIHVTYDIFIEHMQIHTENNLISNCFLMILLLTFQINVIFCSFTYLSKLFSYFKTLVRKCVVVSFGTFFNG